jgi:nicotinamidase-related amidase
VTTSKKSKLVKRKPSVALLLIDVINDLEFEGANALLEQAVPMARQLAQLKLRVVKEGIPCIYVNDNFGHWKSDFRLIFKHCTGKHVRGAQISRRLRPLASDFFVLKPKHSGFFATTLDILLKYLDIDTLIITGIAANICVLFTANDAYMRDYQLYVPSDCVASESTEGTQYSLRQIETILKANTQLSAEIDLSALAAKPSEQPRLPERHKLIRK